MDRTTVTNSSNALDILYLTATLKLTLPIQAHAELNPIRILQHPVRVRVASIGLDGQAAIDLAVRHWRTIIDGILGIAKVVELGIADGRTPLLRRAVDGGVVLAAHILAVLKVLTRVRRAVGRRVRVAGAALRVEEIVAVEVVF